MQVIVPVPVTLARTGASPVFVQTEWASGQSYARGTIRRRSVSGSMRDFRCKWSHTSSSSNGPPNSWYWEDRGPAATSGGYTWTTNVQLSNSAAWVSGQAVAADAVRYDSADDHDYVAPLALTTGENTLRPGDAVRSADEAIAARWLDLGAANAWAMLDYQLNSYLQGFDASGTIVDPVFTVDVTTPVAIDRLGLAGLVNVQTVTAKIYVGGVVAQTVTKSLVPSGTNYGVTFRSAVLPINAVSAGATMAVEITLARYVSSEPATLAVFCAGRSHQIAITESRVETSILSFSRKERNEVFGTVRFIRRGSARRVRAQCMIDPASVSPDVVQQLLANWDGMPVFWDFNNALSSCGQTLASDIDRYRVFGFFTNPNLAPAIEGASFTSFSIDVEGLVE